MKTYIQHLRFNPPTNRETWPKVVAALEYFYGRNKIGWSNGEPLIHATYMVNATLAVQYEDWRNYYRIARSDDYIPGGQYGLPEPIDGWKWVEEMTKSDGLNFIDDVWGRMDESEEYRLKTGDVLYFKNSEIRAYTDDEFTVGKFYPITYINYLRDDIRISDDIGSTHHYTIKPDGRGFSYKTWFIDIPEDIQNIDFFGPLYEQEEDEFEWAREILRNSTTTTLGNLFHNGLIEDGDIVSVQGRTDNGQGKMVELNNVKFIFHSVGNEFSECRIELTPEIKEIFKGAVSPENNSFFLISTDENLNVLNIIKADQNKK